MTKPSFLASTSLSLLLTVTACMEKDRNDTATPASVPSTSQTQSALQSPAPIQETASVAPNTTPQGPPSSMIGNGGATSGDGGEALGSGGTGGTSGRGGTGGTGGHH
jgi:hypothetical protein